MIDKIAPRPAHDLRITLASPDAKRRDSSDFRSVLTEQLADSKPLEWMLIQFLSRSVELFLSRDSTGEAGFFVTSPFSFHSPGPPSKAATSLALPYSGAQGPLHAQGGDNPPVLEPSNSLHQEESACCSGIDEVIEEASQKYGVETALIRAVIAAESGGNPNALSPAGAQGMMQLMPRTAAELGVINPFDPAENIMAGTRYLRRLLDRYRGNFRLALAAYNWGMGNVEKRPEALPEETRHYILKVEHLYRNHSVSST